MGQAEVVSHLVRDGGGEANGVVVVILQPTRNGDVTLCYGGLRTERESAALTWFTPPEFSVHMANLLASPTVSPSKSLPLQEGGGVKVALPWPVRTWAGWLT